MIGQVRRGRIVAGALGFTAVHAMLAVLDAPALTGIDRLVYYGALALAVAVVVAVLLPWPLESVRRRLVGWAVVLTTVLAELMVVAVLPDDARGFSLWIVSLAAVPLAGAALRGLPATALTAAAVNAATTLVWSAASSAGLVSGLYRVVTPTAAVVVAVAIAGLVDHTARSVASTHAQREDAARTSAVTRASDAERQRRIAEVERLTGPVLRRLAAGEPVDERLAAECRLLEASLRDDIRAPALATAAVREAAWPARARGVEVRLLDMARVRRPEAAAQPVAVAVRRFLVRVLEAVDDGAVTARLSRDGSATLVVVPGRSGGEAVERIAAAADAADPLVERDVEVTDSGELLVSFRVASATTTTSGTGQPA